MPAIGAAISVIVGAIGTAVTAIGATAVGSFFLRLGATVALSALARALAPKPRDPGIQTQSTQVGGVNPLSFVLGTYATAGTLVAPPLTHGPGLAYPRSGFMHVDLGPERKWGTRFPVREAAFAVEPLLARKVLAESRTMKGGGAAGVATIGAAGVEVAQNVLAETQSAVLPLVPYLDTLRWVFIVVALAGIAVTIYARLNDWTRWRR